MLNLNRLRKDEILWMFNHRCRHNHRYLEHQQCFIDAGDKVGCSTRERIGFFDIETSGLNADFAFIFSYAIRGDDGKLHGRTLRPEEIQKSQFDKNLVAEMCADLRRFDRVVVHYGGDRRFDLPFSRTRAIKHGADFPLYKEVMVSDTWLMSKNKLKLRSNRLAVICEFFGIKAKEHPLNPDVWQKACAGDKKALAFIWVHNVEDIDSMKKVYYLLEQYTSRTRTSV